MRVAAALLALLLIAQQNGYDLFQKALVKERAEGKIDEAIQIYEQIIREFSTDRALVAKAQDAASAARARLATLDTPAKARAASMTRRRLWSGLDAGQGGAVSLDGQYISAVDAETGGVLVVETATLRKHLLAQAPSPWTNFAENPIPSPDGRVIAYMWDGSELRLIKYDREKHDNPPRVLYHNADVQFVAPIDWTRDGKQILVKLSKRDRTNQIGFVSVADGSLRVLKTLDWRGSVNRMSLSPDGRYIAYDFRTSEESPNRDIFVLASDASRETVVVEHPANDYLLGWAPDGKTILFGSDRSGRLDAWAITVEQGRASGSAELVHQDIGHAFGMGFTKSGAFYYSRIAGMADIHMASVDFNTGKLITAPRLVSERFVGSNDFPAWSADGKYLAYVSVRGFDYNDPNSRVIVTRSIETGEEREIHPQLNDLRNLNWALDGHSFVVRATDGKGQRGIYRIGIPDGDTTLIRPSEPDKSVQWLVVSPDGNTIYFTERRKGRRAVIASLNISRGEEKDLVSGSWFGDFGISPDGKCIVFHTANSKITNQSLKLIAATGGEARQLAPIATPSWSGFGWTADSRFVIFATRDNQIDQLWKISIDGGSPQKLDLTAENIRGLRVHPDGRRIAFTAGQSKSEVWVIENFLPRPVAAVYDRRISGAHRAPLQFGTSR